MFSALYQPAHHLRHRALFQPPFGGMQGFHGNTNNVGVGWGYILISRFVRKQELSRFKILTNSSNSNILNEIL